MRLLLLVMLSATAWAQGPMTWDGQTMTWNGVEMNWAGQIRNTTETLRLSESQSGSGTHVMAVSEYLPITHSLFTGINPQYWMTWNGIGMIWNGVGMQWQPIPVEYTRAVSEVLPVSEKQLRMDISLITRENWPGIGYPLSESATGIRSGGFSYSRSTTDLISTRDTGAGHGMHVAATTDSSLTRDFGNRLYLASVRESLPVSDLHSTLAAHFAAPSERLPVSDRTSGLGTHSTATTELLTTSHIVTAVHGVGLHLLSAVEENIGLRESAAGLSAHISAVSDATPVRDSGAGLAAHFAATLETMRLREAATRLSAFRVDTMDIVFVYDEATGSVRAEFRRRGVIISH